MNREQIQLYGDSFTAAERVHAVSELRAWLQFDTWTVREGLLLLVGIDPHRSDDLVLEESGFSSAPNPTWARITAKPALSPNQVDAAGWPRITGEVLDLFQIQLISRLMNLWVSKPGHTLVGRHVPGDYLEWASSKGYSPFWETWAIDAGLICEKMPASKAKSGSSSWGVKKPTRFQGYARPLYNTLKDACNKGESRPTAHEVLEIFKANQPAEVAKILPGQGLDYYTADGGTKGANLKAIREVIRKMTT